MLKTNAALESKFIKSYIEDYYNYCNMYDFPSWINPKKIKGF